MTRRGILHDPESRRPISPGAVKDLLVAYIQLHDQQAHHHGGYQEALDALKEMHKPLQYIAGRYAPRSDTIRELFARFKELSYEVLPKEEREDEEIPFDDEIP